MKITELKIKQTNSYLYEGLTPQHKSNVMLWESVGRAIMEAELTVDQITQLFQQIEQGATAGGGNRTVIGQGKDAVVKANNAWKDLKNKLYNSGPMEGFAAAYEQAAAKLKQATGGDQGAMQYVQKYRDFAKKHPILQGFVYSLLIGAAGISSAGLGGAAALALLKTADKALQGDDIRSALYAGAKTGALAYGASKLADYMKGDQAQQTAGALDPDAQNIADQAKELVKDYDPTKYNYVGDGTEINIIDKATGQLAGTYPVDMATADEVIAQAGKVGKLASGAVDTATNVAGNVNSMTVSKSAYKIFADKVANGEVSDHNSYVKAIGDSLRQAGSDQLKAGSEQAAAQSLQLAIKKAAASAAGGEFSGSNTDWLAQTIKAFGGTVDKAALAKDVAATAAQGQFESRIYTPDEVTALFEHIVIAEGLFDKFKTAAAKTIGQGVEKLKTVGHNVTTKVTADKLQSAWKAAGSPTDSAAIAKVLQSAGVAPDVIAGGFKAVGVKPATPKKPAVAKPGQAKPGAKGQDTPAGQTQQDPMDQLKGVGSAQLPGDIASVIGELTVPQLQQLIAQLDAADKAQAASPATAKPATPAAKPAVKPHTGGKVAGQTSQTPSAVRQRQARAQQKVQQPAQRNITPPINKISPSKAGAPTPQEYDKFQQKLQQAMKAQPA